MQLFTWMSVPRTLRNSHPPGPSETPQTSAFLGSGGACLALLCGPPAAAVSRGDGSQVGVGSGGRLAPSCSHAASSGSWAAPGPPPPGRSQQASPERLTRERKSLPKTGAAFSVSEHRHSCPGPWTHAQPGMEVGQDHPGREDGAPGSPHTTAQSTETLAGLRTSLERHLINIIHNEAF